MLVQWQLKETANTDTVPSWSSIPTHLILEELRRRGEDEVKEKPSCKSAQQGHYNVPIHVVALVIILVLSTAGTFCPQPPLPPFRLYPVPHLGTHELMIYLPPRLRIPTHITTSVETSMHTQDRLLLTTLRHRRPHRNGLRPPHPNSLPLPHQLLPPMVLQRRLFAPCRRHSHDIRPDRRRHRNVPAHKRSSAQPLPRVRG